MMTYRLMAAFVVSPIAAVCVSGLLSAVLPLADGQSTLLAALLSIPMAVAGAIYCYWAPSIQKALAVTFLVSASSIFLAFVLRIVFPGS